MNIVLYDKSSLFDFQFDFSTGYTTHADTINIENIKPINLMITDMEIINYSDLIIFYHNKQLKILKDRIYGNRDEVWHAKTFFEYYNIDKMIHIIRLFDNEGKMIEIQEK